MNSNEFTEEGLSTFNQEPEKERFYKASLIRNYLICPGCDQRYVNPLSMPCSHNICSNCFKTLKNDLPPASIECPVCQTRNEIPTRGYPLNPMLSELLEIQPVDIKRGKTFEKLINSTTELLHELNGLIANLNDKVNNGESEIKHYCTELREQVNYSTNKKIDQLNRNRDVFLSKINDYQLRCIDTFLRSRMDLKESLDKSLFDLDEWRLGLQEPDSDETDIEDVKILAENLKRKLENELFKFEFMLFGNERLKFVQDEHEMILSSIGHIHLEKVQSESIEEGYGSLNESKFVPH